MRKQTKWSSSRLLDGFQAYLREVCGLSPKTCSNYTDYTCRFLRGKYGDGTIEIRDLRADDLIAFITEQSCRYKPGTLQIITAALRSLIRFLQMKGSCDGRLVYAVPGVANWRLSSLPVGLGEDQLPVLLKSFDRSRATGLRDYAMVECMATLGLRVGEVAGLSLDDIDWRTGVVQLPKRKARHGNVLPLPPSVGQAIADYLRHGRLKTAERRIFVCHRFRIGDALGVLSAKTAIGRALKRAGITPGPSGSHILRHTAATRMLRNGATLKEIADVLGHRRIETTAIYAKVDLKALAEVALPWPEVRQ